MKKLNLICWAAVITICVSPLSTSAREVGEKEATPIQEITAPTETETEPVSDVAELGTIVVTANRYPQTLDQIPNSLSVVTEEEIVDQDVSNVGDILRTVPGVQVISLGSPGEDLDIRLRGTDRDETLIYLDGIKLNNPSTDRTHLSEISPATMERIEVLRGSQSVLYGSDAIGGVVQLFTKKGPSRKGHEWSFDFSAGNLQTFREIASTRGGSEKISYSFNYTRTDQRGRFKRDRFRENAFSANAQFRLTDSGTLSIYGNYWQSAQQLPTEFLIAPGVVVDPAVPPMTIYVYINNDINREAFRHYTANRIAYEQIFTDWWDAEFSYAFTYFKEKDVNSNQGDVGQTTPLGVPLTPSSYINKIRSYRHDFLMQHNFVPLETDELTDVVSFGFEFESEDVRIRGEPYPGDTPAPPGSIGPIPPNPPFPSGGEPGDRQNYAVFAQNNFSYDHDFGTFVLNAGVRMDHNTTFDTELSPRGAVSYLFKATNTKIKGSYSEGFHAPTVVDFYFARQLGLNPKLKPETTQSYEAGIEQGLWGDKIRAEVTFFYIDFDNLITGFQNINDAYSWGIESGLHFHPIKQLWLGGNYTYNKAIDESNGHVPLPNRARHMWHAYLTYKPIPRLTARLDLAVMGDQLEELILVNNRGVPVSGSFVNAVQYTQRKNPGYTKLDLALAYSIFKDPPYKYFRQLRLHAKVNNLTNSRYDQRYGFPSPGINFLAGAEATF